MPPPLAGLSVAHPCSTLRCPVTLRFLSLFFSPIKAMTALLDRIVGVIAGFQSREAYLRQQLADALSDDAADEAAIAAAQRDALAAMERAATAEALMAQLQASAADAQGQLDAIGTYLDQFVPALTDTEGSVAAGGDTAVEPVDQEGVAGDNSGADEIGLEPGAAESDPATSTDEPAAA
jgi:hypothetical protein